MSVSYYRARSVHAGRMVGAGKESFWSWPQEPSANFRRLSLPADSGEDAPRFYLLTGHVQHHRLMLRYHVAFHLPQTTGEIVVAEALDFPGAVTQGFDLPDARLMIAGAMEDWPNVSWKRANLCQYLTRRLQLRPIWLS
jgi:hypothetical protein